MRKKGSQIIICFTLLIVFVACRKIPRNNSRYIETLTYNNNGNTYQREWYLDTYKFSDAIIAIHIEEDTDSLIGKRSYWMNIASESDKKNNAVAAYIYDNEKGIFNGRYTLRRLYSYVGEKYSEHNQINYKGTFQEIIVYYDTAHVLPNDTTTRTGTYILEYEGKIKD